MPNGSQQAHGGAFSPGAVFTVDYPSGCRSYPRETAVSEVTPRLSTTTTYNRSPSYGYLSNRK